MFWDDKIVSMEAQIAALTTERDTLTEANSDMGVTIGRLVADRDFHKSRADEYREFWQAEKQEKNAQELRALEAEGERDAALTERDALQELAVQLLTLIEVGAGNDSPEYTAGVAIMAGAMGVRVPARDAGGGGGA